MIKYIENQAVVTKANIIFDDIGSVSRGNSLMDFSKPE